MPIASRHRLRALLLGLLAFMPVSAVKPDPPDPSEHEVKAALVFKLAKFVTWPPGVFSTDDQPFGLCVLGENPFGTALDLLGTLHLGGRAVRPARHMLADTAAANCQLVFVTESPRESLGTVIEALGERPILTVSDIPGFADRGGIVEIVRKDQRLGFRISLGAMRAAKLRIAAPLLDLSDVIVGDRRH